MKIGFHRPKPNENQLCFSPVPNITTISRLCNEIITTAKKLQNWQEPNEARTKTNFAFHLLFLLLSFVFSFSAKFFYNIRTLYPLRTQFAKFLEFSTLQFFCNFATKFNISRLCWTR